MSDAPRIIFNGISKGEVSATYANLPPSSRIVFMNKTSGQPFAGGVDAGGSASINIQVPPSMPPGNYYLEAKDSTGAYLAQSVLFQIDTASA